MTDTTSISQTRYLLPNHEAEKQRLIVQYEAIKASLDGRVILAPLDLDSALIVLDAGTGPGSWIEDASKVLPSSAILHGIDINDQSFPSLRPLNSSFSRTSILDLPSTWGNRFDLVHQRLLIWALSMDEWKKGLRDVFRILRPGGWVQIGEIGSVLNPDDQQVPKTAEMTRILRHVLASRELCADISVSVPELLRETGFEDIRMERFSLPLGAKGGQVGRQFGGSSQAAFRTMKPIVVALGGLGLKHAETEFDDLIDAAAMEWDTVEVTLDFWYFCACKPA